MTSDDADHSAGDPSDPSGPDGPGDPPRPDHRLVAPLSIPADSRVPDPETGSSGSAEYDLYFRIMRDDPGLLTWTRACLRINGELLEDLGRTALPAEDKCQIMYGLLTVQQVTLERWAAAGDLATGPPGPVKPAGSAEPSAGEGGR